MAEDSIIVDTIGDYGVILRSLGELLSPIHMRAKPCDGNCKASAQRILNRKIKRHLSV